MLNLRFEFKFLRATFVKKKIGCPSMSHTYSVTHLLTNLTLLVTDFFFIFGIKLNNMALYFFNNISIIVRYNIQCIYIHIFIYCSFYLRWRLLVIRNGFLSVICKIVIFFFCLAHSQSINNFFSVVSLSLLYY